ncbi:hypothetical protein J2794_003372 [Paraburkholderia terricola]|uniref:hypothetical protein n=1 Tax=Paraburkholderia terricola TaxID=169427 RepID=UPI002862F5DF|nr:hypothetical protein [Paraburkholderia terricola]MDR6447259.1 hypothetical protein [Paraburkholderia terricola]
MALRHRPGGSHTTEARRARQCRLTGPIEKCFTSELRNPAINSDSIRRLFANQEFIGIIIALAPLITESPESGIFGNIFRAIKNVSKMKHPAFSSLINRRRK